MQNSTPRAFQSSYIPTRSLGTGERIVEIILVITNRTVFHFTVILSSPLTEQPGHVGREAKISAAVMADANTLFRGRANFARATRDRSGGNHHQGATVAFRLG